jgi:hypothetical protein
LMKFWGKLLLLIYNHSTWKDNGKNWMSRTIQAPDYQ